jgi:hypothetical protein
MINISQHNNQHNGSNHHHQLDARGGENRCSTGEGIAPGAVSANLGAPVATGPSRASEITNSLDRTAATARAAEVDLLKEIVGTSLGPLSKLTDTLNLTLDQVSAWIAEPENRRDIFNLLGLLDVQTQMLICQQRLAAAMRLAQIMRDDEAGPETVRRACKDMLNMRLIERSHPRSRAGNGGVVTADDLAPLPLPTPTAKDLQRMLGGAF